MELLFAADSEEWKGIVFLAIFLFLYITSFFAGWYLRGRTAVPPRALSRIENERAKAFEKKESYKRLCERYSSRITSASALVHALNIKSPSEDLDKVSAALRGFDSLIAHGEGLQQLTPAEVNISGLIPKSTGAGNKDA